VREGGREGSEDGKIDAIEEEEEVEGTMGLYGEKHCMASQRLFERSCITRLGTTKRLKAHGTYFTSSATASTLHTSPPNRQKVKSRTSFLHPIAGEHNLQNTHTFRSTTLLHHRHSQIVASKSTRPCYTQHLPSIYSMPGSPTNLIQQQHPYTVPLRADPLLCVTKYTLRLDTIPKPRKQEGEEEEYTRNVSVRS
jgi:hypothetical protein